MSNSVRPHGLQPARLLHPWAFPGNSTGVGCHCFLQITELEVLKSLEHSVGHGPREQVKYLGKLKLVLLALLRELTPCLYSPR